MGTRRYHGLLVANARVLLTKIEETLVVAGRRYELSTNRYPGAVHPQGYTCLKEFRRSPFPTFFFECDGARLEKTVFLVHGEDTVVVRYTAGQDCELELRPLVAFRDYHSLTHENTALSAAVDIAPGLVTVAPYPGLPALYLAHAGGRVDPRGCWYRNFEYDRERERGLDFQEDLFQPYTLTLNLAKDQTAAILASTAPRNAESAEALRQSEIARRNALGPDSLHRAGDQFLVQRAGRSTIIAGYHWFTDWGRDTMISLPGLTLSPGKLETARAILLSFASVTDRGMLPNRFPDSGGAPEYNTADATLWYFEAVRAYTARSGDFDLVRDRLYAVLADIVSWHERGTRFGIRMDADGLLHAGEPGTQLTWMDAKVGDWVVTPRVGKPVEIQALWYNALRTMEHFAGRLGHPTARARYASLAGRAAAAFARFWNGPSACLYDVLSPAQADSSIRPNQIFAVSLFHSMLPPDRAAAVVEAVLQHLLTPFGLRTLAPSHPQYRGRYQGGPLSRDGAYHQGTVWPWLLGPFIEAWLKVHAGSAEAREQAARWLAPLLQYLDAEGEGQLPEVFDGDPPHRAGGAIAQAWSVAELLRVRQMLTYKQ